MCPSAVVAFVVALGAVLQGCFGGGCTADQAIGDSFENKVGSWVLIQSNPSGKTELTYRFGWDMKGDHGIPEDDWWGATKASLESGFSVAVKGSKGSKGSKLIPVAKVAVPIVLGLVDALLGSGAEIDDGEDSRYAVTTTFQAGAIWQWDMSLSDQCGDAKMKSKVFMVTSSAKDIPCCLPGMSWDNTKQLKGCSMGGLMCSGGTSLTTQETCDPLRSVMVQQFVVEEEEFRSQGYGFLLDSVAKACQDAPECNAILVVSTDQPQFVMQIFEVCYPVPLEFDPTRRKVLIIPNKPNAPHPTDGVVQALV